MSTAMQVFSAGMMTTWCINMVSGYVADRSWWAVAWQPLLTLNLVIGMAAAMAAPKDFFLYVIGTTVGAAISIAWRRACNPAFRKVKTKL